MAKDKRFPSPANVEVTKDGMPAPVVNKEPKGPYPEIKGKAQKLVTITYHGDNHVVLHNGVHHLAPGMNHLPEELWSEAKKHSNIQQLMKDKKLHEGEHELPPAESKEETPDLGESEA